MTEVPCGYCEHFKAISEELQECKIGRCDLKNLQVAINGRVCEDFFLASGIYTKKTIPEYCKNRQYEKNKYGMIHRKTDYDPFRERFMK